MITSITENRVQCQNHKYHGKIEKVIWLNLYAAMEER